jgi:hypothetical protein
MALFERLELSLETNPLALILKPTNGRTYRQFFTPAMAQSLALALLANASPAMGAALAEFLRAHPAALLPEVAARINETAAEFAARDRAALRELGVSQYEN